jgi:hypothetical protein
MSSVVSLNKQLIFLLLHESILMVTSIMGQADAVSHTMKNINATVNGLH